jgi:hypothetical protein
MLTARFVLEPSFTIAPVNRRLFGGFVESSPPPTTSGHD